MRTLILVTALALLALAVPAVEAQPPSTGCGYRLAQDPGQTTAVGCGTFVCYIGGDEGFRCFG